MTADDWHPKRRGPPTAANLFAAAKGYALAMHRLNSPGIETSSLSIPFYFLAGFSLELSFKSIVMVTGGKEPEIKSLGHDLQRGYQEALKRGYAPPSELWLGRMVNTIGPPHRDFELRYIPDVYEIQLPRANILMKVLGDHLDAVEALFPVWEGLPDQAEF